LELDPIDNVIINTILVYISNKRIVSSFQLI
jgi:hypothetical protein